MVSFKNSDGSWIESGESKTFLVEVDSTTDSPWFAVYFNTTDSSSFTAGESVTVSDIRLYATADDIEIYNTWYTTDNSTYIYKTQNAETEISDYFGFDLDNAGVADWSAIKYISADVEVTGKTMPVITSAVKNVENSFMSSAANVVESTSQAKTQTLYLNTNGKELEYVNLEAWNYDEADQYSIAANTVIKVKNITCSTNERDYSNTYDEWYYLSSDKSWNYKAKAKKEWVESPFFDSSSVTDWTKIKYISADIEITGDAYPVICATDKNNTENAVTGSAITIKDASRTIYLNTNGAELQDVRLELWGFGEGDNYAAVTDGVVIKVKNITFSENERDYTNVYDEWYPVTGGWQIKMEQAKYGSPVLNLKDAFGVSIKNNTYLTLDIKCDKGSANGMQLLVFSDDGNKEGSGALQAIKASESVTMFAYNYDGIYGDKAEFSFWEFEKGTVITVSNPKTYTTSTVTNYKDYKNTIVEYEKGKYYFCSTGVVPNTYKESTIAIPYNGDVTKIQTVTVEGYANEMGTATSQVMINTNNNNGFVHQLFPLLKTASKVERYFLGKLNGTLMLQITTFHGDSEVYIESISYSTDDVELPLSTPNDILIDYNGSLLNGANVQHVILQPDVEKIETAGTLRFDVEPVFNSENVNNNHSYTFIVNDWSGRTDIPDDWDNNIHGWYMLEWGAVNEAKTVEFKISKEFAEYIQTCSDNTLQIVIEGAYIKVSNVWFTPESDAPAPESEAFDPNKTFNAQEKQNFENQLSQSKNNQMTELEGFKHIKDKNKYDKPQGHKHFKKDKNGNDVYSMRIVKMVDKEKLKGAKSISITLYSKKSGRYVTIKAQSCYGQLNVNGQICEAEQDMAFLTVVFDNVQGDDEITYTDFTINY